MYQGAVQTEAKHDYATPKGFWNFFFKFSPCILYTRPFNKAALEIIHQNDTKNQQKCKNILLKMEFNFILLVFAD